jgi:hypothetical protein
MTAAQRGELARLRVHHPRARVTVNAHQPIRPAVRVTMRWTDRCARLILMPDGRRVRMGGAR